MSAAIATAGYVPPFATATPAAAAGTGTSISFARIATTAGTRATGTATTTATALIVDSTGGVNSNSLLEYFTKPYLDAHTLSRPSWRYAYIFWFFVAFVLVVWSIAYQASGPGSGTIGAWFRKWSIRRLVIGGGIKKTPLVQDNELAGGVGFTEKTGAGGGEQPQRQQEKRKRMWASPTIAQMLAVFGLIVLCPTTCTFGGTCPYNLGQGSGPPKSTYRAKRAVPNASFSLDDTPAPPQPATRVSTPLDKRGVNNPNGWAPFNDPLLAAPNYNIAVNTWAAADRLGLISYAMLPLTVSLALKQWPFNFWASPFLTNYHFDKTAILHRWSGRVIWLFSTAHTAAWFYELSVDLDPFGRPVIVDVWVWFRFVAGVVAYIALTAMMILSISSIRNRHYEVFYWSHVFLVIVLLVGCLIHAKPLMGWPISGLGVWGAERLARLVILVYINKYGWNFGAKLGAQRSSGQSFTILGVEKAPAWDETKSLNANSYPPTPYKNNGDSSPPNAEARQDYYDHGPGHKRQASQEHTRPLPLGAAPPQRPPSIGDYPLAQRPDYSTPTRQTSKPDAGYATAQLLPGKMIRLTLNVPASVRWRPGQHVILTLPTVKFLQGHPYTITNVDERAVGIRPAGSKPQLRREGTEVVLLVRAQKGFSKALWDHCLNKRRAKEVAGAPASELAKGVTLRSLISWPLGSAGRVTWDDYESLLVVCGGTGVTFGISVLEYTCKRMARIAANPGSEKNFKTQRVRFVWILREYAHLSWVAPTIRRCMEMINSSQLQIELFVSRDVKLQLQPRSHQYTPSGHVDDLAPPRAPFARPGMKNSSSRDSMYSEMSDSDNEGGQSTPSASRALTSHVDSDNYHSVTDMVMFDGEDDYTTPAEAAMSTQLRQEGKIRRARSRRQAGGTLKGRSSSKQQLEVVPLALSELSNDDLDQPDHGVGIAGGRPHFPEHDHPTPSYALSGSQSRGSLNPDNASFAELGGFVNDDQSEHYTLGGASSVRHLMTSSQSHSILDFGNSPDVVADVTQQDQNDLDAVAELARPGYPRLDAILDAEMQSSPGKTMVACCGPTELNTLVRNLVSNRIDLRKVMRGDVKGHLSLVTEDFGF